MTDKDKQEELFKRIQTQGFLLTSLAGMFQNDFSRMLEEGDATIEQIKESKSDFSAEIEKMVESLKVLENDGLAFLDEVLANNQENSFEP